MNEECKRLLNQLSFSEYRTFIRNALGLLFFDSFEKHIVLSSKSRRNINRDSFANERYKDAVAYAYIEEKGVINPEYEFVFCVSKQDYENKIFRQNGREENIDSYFLEGKLTNSDLFFLLLVSFNDSDSTLYYKKTDLTLKTYSDIKHPGIFSFILGSGIDVDYGIEEWDALIDKIAKKASIISGVESDVLLDFSTKRCNTNYYTPQILKDISSGDYFDIIRDFLYSGFDERTTYQRYVPSIINRNLYQVCRIVCTQKAFAKRQTILTFNYDDIIEQTLLNSFDVDSFSSYENHNGTGEIVVEHVHGLLPYRGETMSHRKSIVLSHDEYLNNYESNSSYSYSKLYNQLRKTNLIIGNSISDYEEQKVFYNHHKMYLNEFSYALMIKNKVDWLNYYTIVSLYKIGIIPIFFDSFPEMCDYLKTIWPSID